MAFYIDLNELNAGILECEQLAKSAGLHTERKEHNLAIQDLTRIIELVTKLSPMFSAKGESLDVKLAEVYKEPYMAHLKLAYATRYKLYFDIGEKAKSDADWAMCRKLGVDLPVLSTPNKQDDESILTDFVTTPAKKFPSAANVNEYQKLADQAFASDNYEEAIGYCDKALEQEPLNWIAMLTKAQAIGFLATPENSRGTLNGDNQNSVLFKSFTWFQKAQITYVENFEEMNSSGKEFDPDFITWSQAVYQASVSMVVDNFESKIPPTDSTQKKFLSWTELIPLYVLLLSCDPENADDIEKEQLRDSAQRFRNKFSTFFESYDACDLIQKYLPEVRVWLHTLNRAETILKSFNPNYNSILVRIKNSTLIELDAGLAAELDSHKSLVSQNSFNSSRGSGCLGVIVCVIIVAYSLIA